MANRKEFQFFKWIIMVLGTAILLQTAGCGEEAENIIHETETPITLAASENEEQDETGLDETKQDGTGRNLTEQDEAKQVEANQNEAGRNVTELSAEDAPVEDIEWEPETLGNPRSSFGLGSAPFLKGRNILVSMFVTTPESSFTHEEQLTALDKLKSAVSYIETQAAEYGAEAELLCDWTEYGDLYAEAATDFAVNESSDYIELLDEEIAKWFSELICYDELMEKYGAQGIATCVFINNPGISYAIVYDGTDNEKESIILFTGDYYRNGEEESAATYAHEILHVFGAHDLYEGAEFTREVTDYLSQKYPEEIMTDVSEGDKYVITRDISPVTAYHLGWLAYSEEIDRFPQLSRD